MTQPRSFSGYFKNHKLAIANIGLVFVLLLGSLYMAFGVLRWNPFKSTYDIKVNLTNSGGIQEKSDVTLRGLRIGEVSSLKVKADHVEALLKLESNYKINKLSTIKAQSLSGVGEQYLDFQPQSQEGPYLKDGDIISTEQSSSAIPFSKLLDSTLNVIRQIDPAKLQSAVTGLDKGLNSSRENQLRALVQNGGTILFNLVNVLPETVAVIKNGGKIFQTTAGAGPDLTRITRGTNALMSQLAAADKELRLLLSNGPNQFSTIGSSLNAMQDPLINVIRQVAIIAKQGALRAPGLVNLFPGLRDGTAALLPTFPDKKWRIVASIYPSPYCAYPGTPLKPTKILKLSVPVNRYCVTNDPSILVRGSANAPRPPGDDTAGPPANYDPNEHTTPLN